MKKMRKEGVKTRRKERVEEHEVMQEQVQTE